MKIQLLAVLFVVALFAVPSLSQVNGQVGDVPEKELQAENGVPSGSADAEEQPEAEEAPAEVNGEESSEDNSDDEEEEEEPKDDEIPSEFKDEVDNVKRRRPVFPQLSRSCCLTLKKYGYCRRPDIKRFCVATCRPPCRDRLSRKSCSLLRYTYKQCGKRFARVYCRKTCKACKKPPPPVWREYEQHWCGIKNRVFIKSHVKRSQCKVLCVLRRGKACQAIEWWGKYNFNCYYCKNPNLRYRYTNTKDLAWPPSVSVRVR